MTVPYPRRPQPNDDEETVATIDRRIVSVAPDCVFALTFAHAPDKMFVYFLEADRSVPHMRYTLEVSATFRKLLAYAGSWSQDLHKTRFNFPSFQVLTVTTGSRERVANMVETFKLLNEKVMHVWDKRCHHRVFLFADRASADPSRLLGYQWLNGHGVPRTFDIASIAP